MAGVGPQRNSGGRSVGTGETAIVQDVSPGDVVRKVREEPVYRGCRFFRAAIFTKWDIGRLFGNSLLNGDPRVRGALCNQVEVVVREGAAQRKRVHMNAAL